MLIKTCIIDDDNFVIEELKNILQKINEIHDDIYIEVIKTYTNSAKAIASLKNVDFDLLFIDFEMPSFNGIEVVEKLNKNIAVIFVSSHKEKSIEIINHINIVGFVKKPPLITEIEKLIVQKIINTSLKKNNSQIKFSNTNKTQIYHFKKEEIFYIKSEGKYKNIYGVDKKTPLAMIESNFNEIKERLDDSFISINKSVIVNQMHLRQNTKNTVVLTNGKEFQIKENGLLNKFIKLFSNKK